MSKVAEFDGEIGGDGECFCWRKVSEADVEKIREHESLKWDQQYNRAAQNDPATLPISLDVLHPGDIMAYLNLVEGVRYRFTITAYQLDATRDIS